jgi:Icc protein
MAVHVLHVSDIHVAEQVGARVYGQQPDVNLQSVVEAARQHRKRFDAVVVTGDVADDASPAGYARVHRVLRPLGDVFRWVPGNHDDPERMAEVDGDALTSATVGPWRLVTLDSQWPGRTPGRLTAAAVAQLDEELEDAGESPCAVLVHHPPRPPCGHADCQTVDAGPLLDVLDRRPGVRAVLSGHMHRSFSRARDLTAWIGAPSTCMQIAHPSHTWTAEPPAAHLVELGDDGSVLVSAVQA